MFLFFMLFFFWDGVGWVWGGQHTGCVMVINVANMLLVSLPHTQIPCLDDVVGPDFSAMRIWALGAFWALLAPKAP